MAIECPECGEVENVRVLETRTRDSGIVDRRHECGRCGARFKSIQLPPKAMKYAGLAGSIRRFEKFLAYVESIKLKEETRQEMMAMRLAGKPCREIAERFEISLGMARKYTQLPRHKVYPNAKRRP